MTEAADIARAYHQRSKHQLQRYAAGPDTLDWDAQPSPWRRFVGAPVQLLPLVADGLAASWSQIHQPGSVSPAPLNLQSVAALLELSFGLSAWKRQGPDRWALRCTPSSGNLHPTEAYVISQGVAGLEDGLWHYAPHEHALERRARWLPAEAKAAPALWLGLSSIHWREAWKYGERAFRYCQLDMGHAVGALRYAAAVLGWQAPALAWPHAELAAWLGCDRLDDFGRAEAEEPERMLAVGAVPAAAGPRGQLVDWLGQASLLDRHPMYRWPVIDEVSQATRAGPSVAVPAPDPPPWLAPPQGVQEGPMRAATLIRQRRSAQRFDARATMDADSFQALVQALQPQPGLPPWSASDPAPRVHPVWFVNRVQGLAPGAYVMPRSRGGEALLRQALPPSLNLAPVPGLPLLQLAQNPALAGTLRTLNCHQALGSDACVALAFLGEFDAVLTEQAHGYRALLNEAGLLGQVLYLHAEALGWRGTGIGCYFDDALHLLLGLDDPRLQSLYHFTLGAPLQDERIATEPAYAHLGPDRLRVQEMPA
ncbi:nitroreductase family protein [Burkholderiales bacterium JOSHI_001]|nr:nitroreductase family protein [Burkholderiales bacterium JOSHI_001]